MEPINFEAMTVGQRVDLGVGPWEGAPSEQFQLAQDFTATHQIYQFEAGSEWVMNPSRGIQEQHFFITRTR